MIRVVIDTGIVVSAAFRNRIPEQAILQVAENPDLEWVVSRSILNEYNEVLARKKFGLTEDILSEWSEMFRAFTTLIDPVPSIDFPRDQKDAMFIECAIAADAHYLITGDRDLAEAVSLTDARIVSASEFLELTSPETR